MNTRGAEPHDNPDAPPWAHPYRDRDWHDLDPDQQQAVATAVGLYLETKMAEHAPDPMTRADLARATNISDSYITQVLRGKLLRRGEFHTLRARRGALIQCAIGLQLSARETRELLEVALYVWHGESGAGFPLSALGNPGDLPTAQWERIVAVGNAVLQDRRASRRRGPAPRTSEPGRPPAHTAYS